MSSQLFIRAATLACLAGLAAAQSPDLLITEVVDGTVAQGQPKWVELTNVGNSAIPDLSVYSLGNFNNGSTTLGGGAATQLNAVPLAAGASYVFAYESSSTGVGICDPVLTCFEFIYGAPPDQYSGPFINGNDAIALFFGLAVGTGANAILLDVYGVIGEDGIGKVWEYTDSYAYRCGTTQMSVFQACDWTIPGPDSLEAGPGCDALCKCQTLTTPGTNQGCTSTCGTGTVFCTAKAGLACGLPSISGLGTPSATASSGFTVSAGPARSCRSGILVYNTTQGPPLAFQGGTLCVEAMGLRRAGSTNSMGTAGNNCDGTFTLDMNAFGYGTWIVPDCTGAPSGTPPNMPAAFLGTPGTAVFSQWWGRDSVATGSFVSDGLTWTIGP
jgi:hypothetical protein